MNHQEINEKLIIEKYVLHQLTQQEELEFIRHMTECETCAKEALETRQFLTGLRTMGSKQGAKAPAGRIITMVKWTLAAAAAILLMIAIIPEGNRTYIANLFKGEQHEKIAKTEKNDIPVSDTSNTINQKQAQQPIQPQIQSPDENIQVTDNKVPENKEVKTPEDVDTKDQIAENRMMTEDEIRNLLAEAYVNAPSVNVVKTEDTRGSSKPKPGENTEEADDKMVIEWLNALSNRNNSTLILKLSIPKDSLKPGVPFGIHWSFPEDSTKFYNVGLVKVNKDVVPKIYIPVFGNEFYTKTYYRFEKGLQKGSYFWYVNTTQSFAAIRIDVFY